jgi:hypothetical protein
MPDYRQPGVIVTQEKNTTFANNIGSFMPVCLVGSGKSTIQKTFKLTKDENDYNAIVDKDGDYVSIDSVVSIGNSKNSIDYNTVDHSSDYNLETETIDGETVDVIRWADPVTVTDAVLPKVGDVFYATVVVVPKSSHYDLKMFTSISQVIEEYGEDVDTGGNVDNIALACKIALENSPLIYAVKIDKVGSTATTDEFNAALAKTEDEKDIYRVVPVDDPSSANNLSVINHLRILSGPDESKERISIIPPIYSSSDAAGIVTDIKAYAEALSEFRAATIYPDQAKRTLSDGNVHILKGQFICTALASMKSVLNPEEPYTGKQITNFTELVGVKLSRYEKNNLASSGVTVLNQEKSGFPVEVRHGLSTDMSSLQLKELSITELADFTVKKIRPALKNYIGKNITDALLTQVEGSVSSVLNSLIRKGHILGDSRVTQLYQVEESPDTIAVAVRVQVPYPCNYIDVVVYYN